MPQLSSHHTTTTDSNMRDGLFDQWVDPMRFKAMNLDTDTLADKPNSTGTWQFMSSELLMKQKKVNSLQDDFESFFWITLFHTLRYMRHNRTDHLKILMPCIFEDVPSKTSNSSRRSPGVCKSSILTSRGGVLDSDFLVYANTPLTNFIWTMLNHFELWYRPYYSNQGAIEDEVNAQNISWEEATKLHPFDGGNLSMRNHDAMLSAFETVLQMDGWPTSDKGVDLLAPEDL